MPYDEVCRQVEAPGRACIATQEPVELAAMAVAAALPALVLRTGRTTRLSGAILLAAYSALAVAFYLAGDA